MSNSLNSKRGFTLVELLVVIAIIGILAGFTFAGIGKFLGMAKIARVQNTLKQVSTSLVSYYTEHGSYPPGYGYIGKNAFNDLTRDQRRALDPTDPADSVWFNKESYMNRLGLHDSLEHYDEYVLDTVDTDYDGRTGRLEYYPPTGKNENSVERTVGLYGSFWDAVNPYAYDPTKEPDNVAEQRPLIYVPVNLRQFRRAKKFWDEQSDGFPDFFNPADNPFDTMQFPPASYDAFVVVSAGPVAHTQGLIYDVTNDVPSRLNPANFSPSDYYHIAGLATYYILTRDIDQDGQYDFDYDARRTNDEDEHLFPFSPRTDRNGNQLSKIGPGVDGPLYRVVE